MILDKIDELLKEVSALSAQNADDVEQLRLKYLSKKGEINALMTAFRDVAHCIPCRAGNTPPVDARKERNRRYFPAYGLQLIHRAGD